MKSEREQLQDQARELELALIAVQHLPHVRAMLTSELALINACLHAERVGNEVVE